MELPADLVVSRLDSCDGELLTRAFSEEEIKEVVWDCDGSKSPGPDGFNFEFFKNCWDIVKVDLLRVMEEFFVNGKLARGCNTSFIVLIPKQESRGGPSQFRPISLISSLYKIIAKVLARRLKMGISKIIGSPQSAFIQGRSILDGVVVLNELVEDAKVSKSGRIFFKADFAKAYDTVSWTYLLDMMKILKFSEKWISWIKECFSTASANVLVNGSPSGEFKLERGIRQGDPLSPFLFFIVAEGLNLLMSRACSEGLIRGVEVGYDKVIVSHLQYADDTLFVLDGTEENVRALKWMMQYFEIISGLVVNFDKSRVFGFNLGADVMERMAEILGCRTGSVPIPYLGMTVGGRVGGV